MACRYRPRSRPRRIGKFEVLVQNRVACCLLLALLSLALGCEDAPSESTEHDPGVDRDSDHDHDADAGDVPSKDMEDAGDSGSAEADADDSSLLQVDADDSGPDGAGGNASDADTDAGTHVNLGNAAPHVSYDIQAVGFHAITDQAISRDPIPVPVLLYAGHLASFNTDLAVKRIDIDYDLIEHPDAWPAWRRNGDVTELQRGAAWAPLHFKYQCLPLPKGTVLGGTFQYLRDAAVGSTAAVKTIDRYRFKDDGTFETCKSTLTVVASSPPIINRKYEEKRGRYEIDGLKILFRYDDGATAAAAFFYDPMRPTRLWFGRTHFTKPANDVPEICAKL